MSTTESSTTERTGTAEDVERLARFCGMEKLRDGVWRHYFEIEVPAAWNPLLYAEDDYEVLERVREVWGDSVNWLRFVVAFSQIVRDRTGDTVYHVPTAVLSAVLLVFKAGDFSRAALAVLKEMEKTEEGR